MNHVTIDRRALLLGLGAAGLPAAAWAQIAPGLPAIPDLPAARPETVGLSSAGLQKINAVMADYMAREKRDHGTPWPSVARHMLGLRNGLPGARRWRQVWSDHKLRELDPHDVMALALDAVARVA